MHGRTVIRDGMRPRVQVATAALLLAAGALLPAAGAGARAEDRTDAPGGEYRLAVLTIDKGIKSAGRPPADVPSRLFLGFRDERCTSVFLQSPTWASAGPSTTWYQTAEPALTLKGGALAGPLRVLLFSYRQRVRDEISIAIDAPIADGQVTGRYTGTARNSVTGISSSARTASTAG